MYAEKNGLCRHHHDFYKSSVPYMYIIRNYSPNATRKQLLQYTAILKNRRMMHASLSITETIEGLYRTAKYMEGTELIRYKCLASYELFVLTGTVTPDQSIDLWMKLIRRNVGLLPYSIKKHLFLVGADYRGLPAENLYTLLIPYFYEGDTEHQLEYLFTLLQEGPDDFLQTVLDIHTIRATKEMWVAIWKRILTEIVKNISPLSPSIQNPEAILKRLDAYHAKYPNSLWHSVRLHVEALLRCEQSHVLYKMRKSRQDLKNEIYAVALNPTRIMRYIKQGIRPSDL